MPDSNRNLPDWLEGFMLLTENSEPPTMFRKWTGISTIASALQRKVCLQLGLSLTFYPNFYIVLVGPSATGKGTAMRYSSDIIRHIPSIRLSAQATSLQALIRRMKETNLTDIDVETQEQIYHSSLTIFSDEFTVFLGYHNRELIAALCDWYDCKDRWVYDTIKRDKEEIIGVWANIIAGTTPDSIRAAFPAEAIGAGLTSRIIFINEDKRDKLVIFPSSSPREYELQQLLISDLESISLMSGTFRFTEDASSYYSGWCYEAAANPPFCDPKFDGYCGRRRKHLLSLAMVCSASENSSLVISKDHLQRANGLLTEAEVKMATVFRGVGRSDIAALISDAIVFIENSYTSEIQMWQFARHFESQMDKLTMDRVLATLEVSKQIKVIRKPGVENVIRRLDNPIIGQTNAQEVEEPA